MVNRWTGAFDAAIELAPGGVNALLAAIHRKGDPLPDAPTAGPHFLHSLALNLPFEDSSSEHDLRGHLQVQVSTPSVSVPTGSDAERVTVSVELYAWFQATISSDPAPEFIHGTLAFTTGLEIVECGGSTLAEIRVATGGVEVSFTPAPGSGLSAGDVSLVEGVIAQFLQQLRPVQLRVAGLGSGDFTVEHIAFKTLGSGSSSALAVLFGFGNGGSAPSPATVSEIFLAPGEDAALALGRGFLTATMRDLAQAPLTGISVSGSRFGVSFSASIDPASLTVELRPGFIRARVTGSLSLSPGGSFSFRLTQDFGLTVIGGDLALTLADEAKLDITGGNFLLRRILGLFTGRALDKLEVAASGVIQAANVVLNRIVDESVGDLLDELEIPGVRLEFERAAIDPDAVILGGSFDVGPTKPAVASFTHSIVRPPGPPRINIDTEYDALASWIPGGTIRRYRWVEVRADGTFGRRITETHQFVLQVQPELATVAQSYGWPPTTWCLQIEGTQFVDARDPVPVSGAVCAISSVVPGLDLPRGGGRLVVHVPDGKGGVLADLDPWSRFRPHALAEPTEHRGFLLVHRAGEDVAEAVKILRAALVEARRELVVFPTIVVDAEDHGFACGAPIRELADLAVTNDPEGAWRARFRLERPGTTVIVGPAGTERWRDAGPLRADVLGKVLEGLRAVPTGPPRWNPVRLNLPLHAFAPDLVFQCSPQVAIAMSKLRGRELELCFWTTWSAASLEELRRRVPAHCDGSDGPLVLFVNDGEDPVLAAQVLAQHGEDLQLVPDPERVLSRKYGVSCWPTVVRVDPEGRIAAVRFGLEPDLGEVEEPEPKAHGPA